MTAEWQVGDICCHSMSFSDHRERLLFDVIHCHLSADFFALSKKNLKFVVHSNGLQTFYLMKVY